jgi:hypothetical protein
MEVKPRKLKVSGLPSPRRLRRSAAKRPNSMSPVFSVLAMSRRRRRCPCGAGRVSAGRWARRRRLDHTGLGFFGGGFLAPTVSGAPTPVACTAHSPTPQQAQAIDEVRQAKNATATNAVRRLNQAAARPPPSKIRNVKFDATPSRASLSSSQPQYHPPPGGGVIHRWRLQPSHSPEGLSGSLRVLPKMAALYSLQQAAASTFQINASQTACLGYGEHSLSLGNNAPEIATHPYSATVPHRRLRRNTLGSHCKKLFGSLPGDSLPVRVIHPNLRKLYKKNARPIARQLRATVF